jgi:DUF4097 and DUF4098 domain-containing protein YvlB
VLVVRSPRSSDSTLPQFPGIALGTVLDWVMRYHAVPVALLLLVATVLPAAAQPHVPFERMFTTPEAVRLDVSTLGGRITLHSGPAGQVLVRGTATVRMAFDTPANALDLAKQIAANPPIERSGEVIRLQPPMDPAQRRAATIAYDVTVPPNTPITARSNSGEIVAADLSAASLLETQSGRIDVRGASGELTVTTGSGAITVQGAGAVSVRSSSSAITIRDARGPVRAQTQSGAVIIDVAPTADVNVETGSSAILVTGAQKTVSVRSQSGAVRVDGRAGGAWNIINSSGRVEFTLNRADSATLDLSNRSGTISIPAGVTTKTATKRHVEATLGAGEHPVTIDSGSGAITLHLVR